jgi:hypothetical protein
MQHTEHGKSLKSKKSVDISHKMVTMLRVVQQGNRCWIPCMGDYVLKHWEPSRLLANMQEGFFPGRREAEE